MCNEGFRYGRYILGLWKFVADHSIGVSNGYAALPQRISGTWYSLCVYGKKIVSHLYNFPVKIIGVYSETSVYMYLQ